ncbi:MAG: hypothetical protein C0606_06005 [Hyphomicrobiales bacterium]|nr:MAG: hypothetical protein C0606_06005 [Hyphomicrobiales bacterium]
MIGNFLTKPVFLLLTVPAAIAVGIGLMPLPLVFLEKMVFASTWKALPLSTDIDTARTLLSVIATGAMTALSLAYSLVLVVFTLAAGNIGPRLLKRFTGELVNQVTAGILGGTFLYSLLTIYFVRSDFVPRSAILGALMLAIVSVIQLIFFVRHVSESVSVDDEIAKISGRVTKLLGRGASDAGEDISPDADFSHSITSTATGYVGRIDRASLVTLAAKSGIVVRLDVPPGTFVQSGDCLVRTSAETDQGTEEKILALIAIDPSRSDDQTVVFSINLLVEIALRALSPGTNDTFTALAVVDSLSKVFAEMEGRDREPAAEWDKDGDIRLVISGLTMKQLMGQAFHPLRRASRGNILMAQGFARALARLYVTESQQMRELVESHVDLLVADLRDTAEIHIHDVTSVIECLPTPLQETARSELQGN